MKIKQIQDIQGQHLVALEHDGQLRCWFRNDSLHAAGVARENLLRDMDSVKWEFLPLIRVTTAKSGRKLYEVEVVK